MSDTRTFYSTANVPALSYYWDGSFPEHISAVDHAQGVLKAAEDGEITVDSCTVLASLIKERRVHPYGSRAWNITAELNTVRQAKLAAQAFAVAADADTVRDIPDHFDIKAWLGAPYFERMTVPKRMILGRKRKRVNDSVVDINGTSIGCQAILDAWDVSSVATAQSATIKAAQGAVRAAQGIADAAAQLAADTSAQDLLRTTPVPSGAYARATNKRTARQAFADDVNELSAQQRTNYLLSMRIVADSDHCKNTHRPATHSNYAQSAHFAKLYARQYYAAHQQALEARHTLVQTIARERQNLDLSYNDMPGKFSVLTHYTVQKLVERLVFFGQDLDPKLFVQWMNLAEDRIQRTIEDMAIASHKQLIIKGFISDGSTAHAKGMRLKPYAPLMSQFTKLWKIINGKVNRVSVANGTPVDNSHVEPFDIALPITARGLTIDTNTLDNTGPQSLLDLTTTDTTSRAPAWFQHYAIQRKADTDLLKGKINSLCERAGDHRHGRNMISSAADLDIAALIKSDKRGVDTFSTEMYVSKSFEGFQLIREKIVKAQSADSHSEVYDMIMNKGANKDKVRDIQGLCGPPHFQRIPHCKALT